ncbi:hypothetical protein DY000_02040082 [Brassica cretica]|uniref:Uncharacterized protein n=1 Tax=Brassica cretica TaxID=69181 RepID=A0ABQ7BC68_BRACR|nr:hypothetical protein DY000_02040082 [Brassica cretica]
MIIITQESLSHISKESQTHVLSQESSELVLNKTCDQLTCFEPVHPSSLVSGSQVLEENSAEEAQTSSPPDEVLEKPDNIEAKTDAKSFSLNSQEHSNEVAEGGGEGGASDSEVTLSDLSTGSSNLSLVLLSASASLGGESEIVDKEMC